MRKLVSAALVAIFVFSAAVPAFAQKEKPLVKPFVKVDPVQFERVEAYSDGSGVLVRWQTKTETNNIGFNVYRVTWRGTVIVNSSMIPGSSAKAGAKTLTAEDYQTFDPNGKAGMGYVVQSYLLDGRRISSESVNAVLVDSLDTVTGNLAVGSSQMSRDAALSTNRNVESRSPELPPELLDEVQSATLPPDLVNHRLIVSKPGARIAVKKEGLYRVPRAKLPVSVFDNTNSANWRLYMQGVEQAIIVGPDDQYIEFYGKGLDTVESDTRVYYLIADTVPGKRMSTKVLRSFGGSSVAGHYSFTAEKKERVNYLKDFQNGDAENYWGRLVTNQQGLTPFKFNLTGVDLQSTTAQITLKMQGYSNSLHNTSLVINDHIEGAITGTYGVAPYSGTFTVPVSDLAEGDNIIDLYTTETFDYDLFDSISISYNRKYIANQNNLLFASPQSRKFDIAGFGTPNIRVFDTTYDADPQLVTNLPVLQDGSLFSVKFPANRQALYYAVEDSAILTPVAVTANNPSALSTQTNGADLVIISHSTQDSPAGPDFTAAAETWANYRRGQGFTVQVVDVADIFDEFNYGSLSSNSVKNFLDYAYHNWQTQPKYVLLLGDGSYDPRNYEGYGNWDLIPAKFVNGIFFESPSDDAMVDFNNDGLAEIAIGRIPARTAADVTNSYNRTVAFETPVMQSLSRGVTFAFDSSSDYNFHGYSQDLRNQLAPEIPVSFVDRGIGGAQANIINEINKSKYLVNYSGHGSTGIWANSSFFGINNMTDLTNSDGTTIFTMLTCLNGYFVRPDADCISEALLRSRNGGAVAAWASTADTTPDFQMVMALRFFSQLSAGNIKRLGDLIKDSKTAIAGSDVSYSWSLLGDPMLRVRQ